MSNRNETMLTLLLKLSAGLLDEPRAGRVRQRIDTDPRWQKRWQRLRQYGFDCEASMDAARRLTVDPQLISEFIDQRLPPKAARRLEHEAWQNAELLREIAITFQLAHLAETTSPDAHLDQPALPHRVVGMLTPTSFNGHTESRLPAVSGYDSAERPITPPPIADRQQAAATLPGKSTRAIAPWLLAVAAGLLLLSTAAVVIATATFGFGPNDRQAREVLPENTQPPSDIDQPPREPVPAQANQSTPPIPEDISEPEGIRFQWPFLDPLVDDDSSPEAPLDAPSIEIETADSARDRPNSLQPANREVYRPIRPDWNRFEGAIGLRDPAGSVIRGYGTISQLTDDMEIQVLPSSWAEGEVANLGRLVVDSDTSLRIGRRTEWTDKQRERVEIALQFGRLAISDIAAETQLLLTTGQTRWPVTVSQQDTTLGIEYAAGMARLFVRRGEVLVHGQSLKNSQHLVWQRGSFGEAEKAQLNARWIDRPRNYARIPDRIRKQLFQSDNLVHALSQLQNSSDASTRLAAAQWHWTLQPALVVSVFRSDDTSQWADALQWLIDQPHGHPRTRGIWRALAEATGNREVVRELARWSSLNERGDLPTPTELERMIAHLASDQLFARFVSAYYLEYYFGNPVGYRPAAPLNVRVPLTRAWRHHIAEVYRSLVQRRRGN